MVEELANRIYGPEVGEQYLSDILALARQETSIAFAPRFGNLLWRISGVPFQLDGGTRQDRQKQVDTWLNMVRNAKPDLGL